MAPEASKTSIPIPERTRTLRAARGRAFAIRFRPGPAAIAAAALVCLLIGLLYLALQIRTILSDQLKQEYAGLVLDAVERAESARSLVGIWQQLPDATEAKAAGYQLARNELTQRVASLAALVSASPSAAPHLPPSSLTPGADLRETDAVLSSVSAWWRAQRDADGADVRVRIAHVARTLIASAALLFCMLITALGMYAKRNRLLAGRSHEFEWAALHDPMTGLPNRRKLFATLEKAATKPVALTAPCRIAVLYVDLDGFKQVNDSLGHRVGDEFLIAVSKRFRESVRKVDVVARIGGDEFAVLIREFSTNAELGEIARRLIGCVVQTDKEIGVGQVRASIGIASFPDPVDDYHRLVAAADEAMYRVKRSGKNSYAFADEPN
ncbi:diguanylate cyclase (GGDEF)-like protein [Paraburkholderia sp. BL23I1N1]|uniref:GGDEF domain-containing protein n=1 Tax=Paraburkholderia sp. BL23I1N1 TaxID=1938802 RepID=UPI000E7339FB|nr:GGDEF domain-containing protein [Paraburkholderia sp. BL23I1N1]RKE38840.1 diguanylate cyclase (GGDEF)-like protein [Paraburkholderia sp. BL23I1N1]